MTFLSALRGCGASLAIWAAWLMIPSLSKKPAANSSSWPGVRMVTLTGLSSTRISKGSSAARSSGTFSGLEPFSHRMMSAEEFTGRCANAAGRQKNMPHAKVAKEREGRQLD